MYQAVLTGCVLLVMIMASPAAASNRQEILERSALSSEPLKDKAGPRGPRAMRIDLTTEVLLNGRPCNYRDVPPDAAVIHLEVAAEEGLVTRIHFRARR